MLDIPETQKNASEPARMFSDALGLRHGDIAAIVGCGGKTSLLYRLADENRDESVLLATTTRIFPPPQGAVDHINPDSLKTGVNLLHGGVDGAKITPPDFVRLKKLCPANGYTFLECDGSRQLPLKGWAEHEPVIPDFSTLTVGICALWPIGQPLSEANTHRLSYFCKLTGAQAGELMTLTHIAAMISSKNGLFRNSAGRKYLLINQVEDERQYTCAQELIILLPQDFKEGLSGIVVGSIKKKYLTIHPEKLL